jgi:drug/metabolite transporter (DMT)-like permease
MAAWAIITVAAAFLQNLRSYLQRRLTGQLSVNGASFVRFFYALPFALGYLGILSTRTPLPEPDAVFLVYCLSGGVAQILATMALVAALVGSNFAVGTALSKTETLQAALFGFVLLGEVLTLPMFAGVLISFVGVLLLSGNAPLKSLVGGERGVILGLLAGTGFAVSAVAFRGASLALPEGSAMLRAAMTLSVSLLLQVTMMAMFLRWREPGELQRVWGARRIGVLVGLTGAGASAGWFTAMTLAPAALVRAVGQVELLFTFVTAVWILRERVTSREITGAILVLGGILLLVR